MGMPAMVFSLVLPVQLLSANERSGGKITICTQHGRIQHLIMTECREERGWKNRETGQCLEA